MAKKVTQLDQRAPLPRLDKVGIYCRVSSATPAQIHSLSAQASFLLRFSLKRWGLGVHDIYIDVGSGGPVEQRPEFMRMLSDIKKRKYHTGHHKERKPFWLECRRNPGLLPGDQSSGG